MVSSDLACVWVRELRARARFSSLGMLLNIAGSPRFFDFSFGFYAKIWVIQGSSESHVIDLHRFRR